MQRSHVTRNRIGIALVIICACVAAAWFVFSSQSTAEALDVYREKSQLYLQAAYLPGVPENPVRERLNTILSSVLVRPLTPDERRALAEEGLRTLKEVETQIDAIGDAGERVQIAISYLEKEEGIIPNEKRKTLIAAAKEEVAIIADIRGLSYRANFHTAEIFNRILLDNGVLTGAYSDSLNRELPLVEEQFNTRAALYTKLKDVRSRVDAALTAMGGAARE